MVRPEAVRRIKSYSAASGYVYQYYFYEVEKVESQGKPGTQYIYMVSPDRKHIVPLRIFVDRAAVEAWERRVGRKLSGTEEYAVAKMRLFEGLDEAPNDKVSETGGRELTFAVDSSNLEPLLAQLNLLENEADNAGN
jgi:hypothetical protein